MGNTSNDGEPQKGSVTVDDGTTMPAPKPDVKANPPGIPDMEIITNQLLELPDDFDNGGKRLTGPFLYPNTHVLYELWFINVKDNPLVELRFWKRENDQKLVPWDGNDFYIMSKRGPNNFDGHLRAYEPGKQDKGPVPMKAVRFSVLPADFKKDENPKAMCFFQLGQEYVIEFRGEHGKIGRDQIRVPETLEKNQVVAFNVIVNEYDPPLPKVYTFKGKIEGYEYKK